jgi:hypothetical protein
MVRRLTDHDAAEFIRAWNRLAVQRSGGIVLCPDGRTIDAHTREQIETAHAAGHAVRFVTGRAARDEHLTDRHEPATEPAAPAAPLPAAAPQIDLDGAEEAA